MNNSNLQRSTYTFNKIAYQLVVSAQEVFRIIDAHRTRYGPVLLATVNLEQIVYFDKNQKMLEQLQGKTLFISDGFFVHRLLRSLSRGVTARLTGPDLYGFLRGSLVCESSVLVVCPSESVAEKVQKDEANVSTWTAPPPGSELIEPFVQFLASRQRDYDYIVIAIGMPNREKLALAAVESFPEMRTGVLLLGAAVEFSHGFKPRCPTWISRVGLEWLFRWAHEPRRLFKRYFVNSWRLFPIFFREIFL